MPAKPVIPSERIIQAIHEWKGNVAATAAMLGIHPKNLRERLGRLGVDLDALRKGTGTYRTFRDVPARVERVDGVDGVAGTYGPKGSPRTVTPASGLPNLSVVPAPMTTPREEAEAEAAPFRASSAPLRPVRVRPAFQERLREAKVEVIGHHKIDTDEQVIFDQFCEEAFGPWLRSKLEPTVPASPKRKKGGAE